MGNRSSCLTSKKLEPPQLPLPIDSIDDPPIYEEMTHPSLRPPPYTEYNSLYEIPRTPVQNRIYLESSVPMEPRIPRVPRIPIESAISVEYNTPIRSVTPISYNIPNRIPTRIPEPRTPVINREQNINSKILLHNHDNFPDYV